MGTTYLQDTEPSQGAHSTATKGQPRDAWNLYT